MIRSLMIRGLLVTAVSVTAIALLGAGTSPAAPTAPSGPAAPGARSGPAVPGSGAGGPGQVTAPPGTAGRAGVIAAGLHVRLSPARLAAAADRCAAWASRAGFANNGYLGGSLTTAVAVALAESGCNPAACYNDTTGQECTPTSSRGSRDSVDRGAWQLNSRAWPSVSDACAYRGLCNARVAYVRVSLYGSYFAPWTTYLTDHFAGFLWAAQQAVSALGRGTITSALIGSCAAHPADRPGAAVRLANCGSGAADQQWRRSGGQFQAGSGLCLSAAASGTGPVTVQRCSASRRQDWRAAAGATLDNAGTRRCLTDPGSSLAPGRVLTEGSCAWRQDKAWFRP